MAFLAQVLLELKIYLYLQRKMCFKNLVTLINISETDDSGADY